MQPSRPTRRSSRARVRRVAAIAGITAVLALAPAAAASAHDYLVSSDPSAGSTVVRPVAAVALTFDEAVLQLGRGSDGVVVTGAGGRHFETGCATVDGDTVTAPVALGASGVYSVAWRIVSADGHPVSDRITFTYRAPAGTPAADGTAHGPDCGVAVPAATAVANGSTVALVIGIAVGAGVLVAAALVVAVIVLRRRP